MYLHPTSILRLERNRVIWHTPLKDDKGVIVVHDQRHSHFENLKKEHNYEFLEFLFLTICNFHVHRVI